MAALDRTAVDVLIDQRRSAQHFVSSFLNGLDPEARFSARSILAEHPEVAGAKSAVLDLALEEFCRRETAGEAVDPVQFASQFPSHASSILHLLQLRDYYEANNELLAVETPAWPEAGDSFLGFVLLDELGRGACSRVYLAIQIDIGERLVVLKLSPNHAIEIEALGRLSHPHIVPIHSVERDDSRGLSVLCMPYLGLATLFDVVSSMQTDGKVPVRTTELLKSVTEINSRFPPPTRSAPRFPHRYVDLIIEIARQIATALEFTHDQGFCHFDIKPTNVLWGSDGVVRLIDFNLAAASSRLKSTGGTVPYMSPEQLRRHLRPGSPAEEGPPSDVFSLGVVLFELLTGRHPFREFPAGEDRRTAAAELLERQPQTRISLREFNPAVDRPLESLVQQCLRPNPADRPTARQLRTRLLHLQSPRRQTLRWLREHARQVQWTGTAIAALAAGSAAWMATREPVSAGIARRAEIEYQHGNLAAAESQLTRAIELDPSRAESWFARGRCRLALSKFEEAYEDFLESKTLNPEERATAYAGYCLCQARPDWQEAIKLLEEAREWGANGPGVLNTLAYCHLMVRNHQAAEECLEACLRAPDVPPQAFHLAGRLHRDLALTARAAGNKPLALQRLELARDYLDRAIASGYETGDVHLDTAWTEALLARETNESSATAIEKINQSLRDAIRLNCEPRGIADLGKFFPQWAESLLTAPDPAPDRPPQLPLVDPFWPQSLVSLHR